jgi:hypothetical protein
MTDNEAKNDPFKPQQPRIPGVAGGVGVANTTAPAAPPTTGMASRIQQLRMPPLWIGLGVGGALVLGIVVAWWTHGASAKATPPEEPVAAPVAAVAPAKPAENLPVGPGPIATSDELAKAWSSKRFTYRDPLTSEESLAIVVRLPGGALWGLSLREPYGNCDLEYVTDLEKIRSEYNFRADHPMVGDPCNRSVFDLTRYGSGPGGLVRGEIAQGAAVRPPMAIEVHTLGKEIVAGRKE